MVFVKNTKHAACGAVGKASDSTALSYLNESWYCRRGQRGGAASVLLLLLTEILFVNSKLLMFAVFMRYSTWFDVDTPFGRAYAEVDCAQISKWGGMYVDWRPELTG